MEILESHLYCCSISNNRFKGLHTFRIHVSGACHIMCTIIKWLTKSQILAERLIKNLIITIC